MSGSSTLTSKPDTPAHPARPQAQLARMDSPPDMQETAKFDPAKTLHTPKRKTAVDGLLGLPRQATLAWTEECR